MPKSKTSLTELLYDIRRIEEHREVLTNRKIKAIYRQLTDDLDTFLAKEYKKYADSDGRLFLTNLEANRRKAKFLQEIAENVDSYSPKIKSEIMSLVNDVYTESYKGFASAVKSAKTRAELARITADVEVNPDVLKAAVNNNISKLTLPSVLEKHRAEIIYQIQQELNIGLINGDRYERMAKRISERVGVSQSKAMNITRTETHRNIESGFMDCAEHLSAGLEGSEYIYAATWHNMGDQRVRPQQRRKTKSGWVTTLSRSGANHMVMEGQTVKVGSLFNLGDGVKAKAPSQSGVAAHDCNCRCFLEYNLMTAEEFEKATKQKVKEEVKGKYDDFDITENGKYEVLNYSDPNRYAKYIEPEYNAQGITEKDNQILWAADGGYIQNSEGYRDINEYKRGLKQSISNPQCQKTLEVLERSTQNPTLKHDYVGLRKVDENYLINVLGIDTDGLFKWSWQHNAQGGMRKARIPINKEAAQTIVDRINELVGTDKGRVIDNGFMSISMSEKLNYFKHLPVNFEIQMPNGTKGLLTNNFDESEFIARNKTGIDILGAKVYNDGEKDGITIFAKIVQD